MPGILVGFCWARLIGLIRLGSRLVNRGMIHSWPTTISLVGTSYHRLYARYARCTLLMGQIRCEPFYTRLMPCHLCSAHLDAPPSRSRAPNAVDERVAAFCVNVLTS